jgi:uncharacterized membrane protein
VNVYLGMKLVHIVSATILFGTGLGTAFFMYTAYRSGNGDAMRTTARNVVLADWIFTTPAVVLQLVTGLWLTVRLGIPFHSAWFAAVISLYALVGACWIPVVLIQIRLRNLLHRGSSGGELHKLFRIWLALGIPAFLSVLLLFALMVYRPWTSWLLFD